MSQPAESTAGSFVALRIANFRILFCGTLFSFTAFFMSTVVQSVVAFELTGTNSAVGAAVFGQGLGMFLAGPLGGAYADRLPKRRVVAIGQTVSAISLGSLGILYFLDTIALVHLVASSFVLGSAFGFIGPARQALVIDLVPAARRGNAMALTNVSNTMSRVIGPFLAGVLLGLPGWGAAWAYWGMAALYLGSACLLIALPRSIVRAGASETHVVADLLDGLRYAWRHPRLRNLLIFFVGVMLIGFPHVTLIPGLLENQLDRPATDVTRMAFFSAIGALVASLSVARFADSARATRIYSGMALAFGATLVLLAAAPGFPSAIAAVMLVGGASGGFHALNGAVIARETDTVYMGRVMSLTMMAFAGFGLTALPLGIAADLYGERVVLLGMGASVTCLAIVMSLAVARDALRPAFREAADPATVVSPGGDASA